jgi:hypothetical protein
MLEQNRTLKETVSNLKEAVRHAEGAMDYAHPKSCEDCKEAAALLEKEKHG